jgi:RNA polymerase sigma factor (TIGR02999 family)
MRRILIDYARARVADKRGGAHQRVSLSESMAGPADLPNEQLIDLDRQLSALEQADPRAARVIELRFFGGLREEDIAEVLQVSVITVKRDWKTARAWLAGRLQPPA